MGLQIRNVPGHRCAPQPERQPRPSPDAYPSPLLLHTKPVVVLSRNDDGAFAGTAEAKALGARFRQPTPHSLSFNAPSLAHFSGQPRST
jgi:hypothetical protein